MSEKQTGSTGQARNAHRRLAQLPTLALFAASLLGIGIAFPTATTAADNSADTYRVPFSLARGKQIYVQKCAQCHGEWVKGTDKGPPLIHIYYEPNHHTDASFVRAIQSGVRQHHWRFGDMPPVEGMDEAQITAVTRFVRWIQEENGIR